MKVLNMVIIVLAIVGSVFIIYSVYGGEDKEVQFSPGEDEGGMVWLNNQALLTFGLIILGIDFILFFVLRGTRKVYDSVEE
ncbi:MAG: hypothetical protein KKF56_02330 [Nanoarchaeota archaeon]|nr:hypothetical protein [Nanoarchaeota archaeon]